MLWATVLEMKKLFDIDLDNKAEDWKLNLFNETATAWMEEVLNRDFTYKSRTRVYRGSGTTELLLKHRPVYPNPPTGFSPISVVIDTAANFGSAPGAFTSSPTTQTPALQYGVDYTLDMNESDGTFSRSGILIRINDFWPRPVWRQPGFRSSFVGKDWGSIQVTTTAGFTVDTLPAQMRLAAMKLVAGMLYLFPLGMPLGGEGYEGRSISLLADKKEFLLDPTVKSMILTHRNWRF